MKSKTNFYKKKMDDLMAENQPFAINDLFEKTSQLTMKKCIDEFGMVYIDINNNSEDFDEFKKGLSSLHNHFKAINKENRKKYVKYINDKIINNYDREMRDYLKKFSYVKSVDLYLKHSQVKLNCLHKYDDNKLELKHEFLNLNHQLDALLKDLDNENRIKRNKIISNVKCQSIKKYKCYMDEKLVQNLKLNKDEFYSCHLNAIEKCLNEFERMTRQDPDLNNDYDSLVSELGSLYSIYSIQNEKKQIQASHELNNQINNNNNNKLKDMFSYLLDQGESQFTLNNFKLFKSPQQLIESTLFMIGFGSLVSFSYLMLIYQFLISFNLKTNLFNNFFFTFKFILYHSIVIFIEFLTIFKSKIKYSINNNSSNPKIKPD
jgi:hypothetical protein